MLFDELVPLDLIGRQCENTPGLGLAFDRNEIELDQLRIIEARRRLFADNQIDAVDLAEALQPRRQVHRIAEQRVVEVGLRAEITDDAFAGIDAYAEPDRQEYLVSRLGLPLAVQLGQLGGDRLGGAA